MTARAEAPFCSRCGERLRAGHADDGCGPYCVGCGRNGGHAEGCHFAPERTLDELIAEALNAHQA
jgi:hypothetical protein